MRKISELAGKAFRECRNFNRDNTSVRVEGDEVQMFLHGHKIAMRSRSQDGLSMVYVSLCGWPTPTTRERLNGLLDALGADLRVYQSKHCQFIGDHEIDSNAYIPVATRC